MAVVRDSVAEAAQALEAEQAPELAAAQETALVAPGAAEPDGQSAEAVPENVLLVGE